MKERFIDKEMDLVIAKECVNDLIKGRLARICLYMLDNNIDDADDTQSVVQCQKKLMVLLKEIGKASNVDNLNDIADEVKKIERF